MSNSPEPLLNLHKRYLNFLDQLEPQWKQDDILMTLLFAVVLFSADNASIKNISQVRLVVDECWSTAFIFWHKSMIDFSFLISVEYFCYVNILRRYLEASRSTYEEACHEFSQLLCILEILRGLRELFEACSVNFETSEMIMNEFLFNPERATPPHLII